MSISKNNVVIHGFSGKFGDLIVFRQRAGKTLASPPPKESSKPPSEKQQAHKQKFQKAILYGKTIQSDPEKKAEYQAQAELDQSAFNVAVADFLQAPDIHEIDLSTFTGAQGQGIRIRVTDDFKVKAVEVSLFTLDGNLVETGQAIASSDGDNWIYTTVTSAIMDGGKIVVRASDNPANLTTEEITL